MDRFKQPPTPAPPLRGHRLRAEIVLLNPALQARLNLASGEHDSQTLADLAIQAGYADRAHMAREVSSVFGHTAEAGA